MVTRDILYLMGSAYLRDLPELMFSAVWFPSNQIQHHAEVMNITDAIRPDEIISGEELEYGCDRVLIIDGEKRYLEREHGKKKSTKELLEYLEKYRGCTGRILWVVDTEPERARYLKAMEDYPEEHRVGLMEDVLAYPRGPVWETAHA